MISSSRAETPPLAPAFELNQPDAMKASLEKAVGKKVELRLVSGEKLQGTVKAVGSGAVQLTELVGAEFYDAAVRLDQVAAVIVRAK